MPAYEINPLCPPSAPFFGFMGAAVALIFASACPPLLPSPQPRAAAWLVCVRGSRRHQSLIPAAPPAQTWVPPTALPSLASACRPWAS